ncbi:diguanylate cyclase [Iamia sp. SCSIO 61187]|uniref:GGDEF domain-containing protein n=1 Tax=Iamia sp. SCSIO 61187 TaxID=2722752 RepID=UPI001C62E364|nr:diguanylate cyclase [Iamia sp. SCSIO 61187]QYG94971.1 diguanylate cyclase [Iamia sp. SCSIO 61187]
MTHRAAPGVISGCLGLVLAVLAMTTEQAWLAGAAGVAALAAGLFTLGLADRLARARAQADAAQGEAEAARAESADMAARAAHFEAEALLARQHAPVDVTGGGAGSVPSAADLTRVTDVETGLFNTAFFAVTLDKRVSAARRGLRPLALALLEPVTGVADDDPSPAVGRPVADCLVETLRDSDIACRLDAGLVAVILEDTPENGAVWTVERVRRRLAASAGGVTLRAGIACYPAHAFDAEELFGAAQDALVAARDWRQDRIEVALLPDE